jgi:hypothetical protein
VWWQQVDYAPTWLAMAGIPTPATMDGRSILTQLIPQNMEAMLPAPTRTQLQADRAALTERPWRKEQFHQYYNQGGPSPSHPQQCPQTDQFRPVTTRTLFLELLDSLSSFSILPPVA